MKIPPNPPSDNPKDNPRWCLLSEEALRRGYRLKDGSPNTRAFSKLLQTLGIEIRGTKKQRVVCPSDIDAAWSRLPLVKSSAPSSGDDDSLVVSLMKARR